MADFKEPYSTEIGSPPDMENADLPAEKKGTVDDQRDMFRMGKAQEMRVSTHTVCALHSRSHLL